MGAALALLLCLAAPVPAAGGAAATLTRNGNLLILTNGAVTVRYDLRAGHMDLEWRAGVAVRHAYTAAELQSPRGPQPLRSIEAVRRVFADERVRDPLGAGIRLSVRSEMPALAASLTQTITVYDNLPFALVQATVGRLPEAGGAAVASGQIEVLVTNGLSSPAGELVVPGRDLRLYRMPFDNDGDITVPPAAAQQGTVSYWLTALFDAVGGAGLVGGATQTRVWKSATWYEAATASLSLFSGARSPKDSMPHAVRIGDRVDSAEFFIGGYADYHDGLEDLMRVVAVREPPLAPPTLPPPLGWNPWYQYDFRADEGIVHAIADFLAGRWAELGYRYVNLDAGWNVMDGDWRPNPERFPRGMAALTGYIHERGLLAGSYFIPFAVDARLLDAAVPDTPYRFRDLVLRDQAGAPVPADILKGEYVLDGTHPGTLTYLYRVAAGIAADGFDFVKLDFLQIGTQEGVHHDPTATAMQAFHRGMAAVRDGLLSAGRPIYLSAAISPLYVHEYAHARRVGTDVNFGQAREAQNVALSWFTDLLYHRNDPDNVVVREDWYPGYSDSLARMHATMTVLGGTLFIVGDDPRHLSPARMALLTDPDVLALAREGVQARPLDVRETPAPVWAARLRDGGVVVGLFNWGDRPARHTVPLARLGLPPGRPYRVRDLWDPRGDVAVSGSITVELPPQSAALLKIGP